MSRLHKVLDISLVVLGLILIAINIIGLFMKGFNNNNNNYIKATDHIYYSVGVNDEEVAEVQSYIDSLPQCIQKDFVGDGRGVVYLVDSLPDKIKGQAVAEDKAVYIVSGYERDHLYHEFAHLYLHDNPFGDDFEKIYEEEAKQMITAYFGDEEYQYSNSTEFYCTAWNIVFTLGGNDVYDVAPKTFEYFTNLFIELYQ